MIKYLHNETRNQIAAKCDNPEYICDCGTSSEVDELENYTELDSDYSDYDSDNASEYSDDIEEDVWALRRKMVGLKNITKEKTQDIRNSYLKLSSKKDNIHLRVEILMEVGYKRIYY